MTRVRYFAAAAEAAGRDEEELPVASVGALQGAMLTAHPALGAVLTRCALLVDGRRVDDPWHPLSDATTVDVLPPFAGG
ncbi:MoaD/ThiS family protein [Planctomonas sp. JC2975]|uniref:MoaD/ThiS family protein n=1 Tax=Planctomonas sp. JC2975 TaxID=2729626 RepID=UPI001475888C|nr:MoaD/ThiS family protein [Planctomonas sp. JC2975]